MRVVSSKGEDVHTHVVHGPVICLSRRNVVITVTMIGTNGAGLVRKEWTRLGTGWGV